MPASGGGIGSSTSSAAILFCFTGGIVILHATPSLQTGGGVCGHPTCPLSARPGAFTHALYRGGNKARRTGAANGDGNGDGRRDGKRAGTGMVAEPRERTQDGDGNGDGNEGRSGDGDGMRMLLLLLLS